jgi:hypothetical protein
MHSAKLPEPVLSIYHLSTSQSSKVDIINYFNDAAEWMKYNPYDSRSFETIKFDQISDVRDWKREKFLKYDLPATLGIAVASLPYVGSEKMKKSF